jgi:UDP-N-acetyl-D-mannosaminuronate dehydrogenase
MSSRVEALLAKIGDHTATVGVAGLGYVGLPFAVEKAKVGFRVLGVEQNPVRAEKVNRGENYIGDVKDEELRELVAKGLIHRGIHFHKEALFLTMFPELTDEEQAYVVQKICDFTRWDLG